MNIKNRIRTLFLAVSSMLVLSSCTQSTVPIKCTLRGVVIDRPQSSQLLLLKQGDDPRINAVYIPINDGKFEYVLNCEHEEQYEIIFNDEFERGGSVRLVKFFSERGVINFTLYPEDRFIENIVEGGKLTKEYRNYLIPILKKYEAIEKEFLAKSKQYFEENFGEVLNKNERLEDDLRSKVEQLGKEGVDIKPVIQVITEMEQSLYKEANQEIKLLTLQFIKEHPTIAGYSVLISEVNSMLQRNRLYQETNDISPYADLYQTVFASKFPNHPYSERMQNLFAGASIKAGVPFVDFTTNDLNGNPVKLSERIKGKPAVLNLWASWCGPCRKKGKDLIPVYEEFRDKGFVVIGVARERNVSTAETAVKTDKYPWENLVELNDAEKIWEKYGIGNSGGMIFLIDENGIIVANDPSVNEIREFLIKKL